MKTRNFIVIHLFIFLTTFILTDNVWPYSMLTIAQIIYLPVMIWYIFDKEDFLKKYYFFFAIPTYISVFMIQVFPNVHNQLFAFMYWLFTIIIAISALWRIVQRGATHIEEFIIDCSFMLLAIGGAWFFFFHADIDLGFSPLITWLTAIHFHYSSFLLPLFIGLAGRIQKPRSYPMYGLAALILPLILAIGISYSRWLELVMTILYICFVYLFIIYIWRILFHNTFQQTCIRVAFSSLGITIIFSILYVLSNRFNLQIMTIDMMLLFHGLMNCVVFSLIGIIGWMSNFPTSTYTPPKFPTSNITGKFQPNPFQTAQGTVKDMRLYEPYIQLETLDPKIIDFYENTINYDLYAKVKWHGWFIPFASFYRIISRMTQQINLPIKKAEVKMSGGVYAVPSSEDGREDVRCWHRKIDSETIFMALYSYHNDNKRGYMNIALPLPFSSMHGILALNREGDGLHLTSEKQDETMKDVGIYLKLGSHISALPISENFYIYNSGEENQLHARHHMKICNIPFLTINYTIYKNEE